MAKIKSRLLVLVGLLCCLVTTFFVGCGTTETKQATGFLDWENQIQMSNTVKLTKGQQAIFGVNEFKVPFELKRRIIKNNESDLEYYFAGRFDNDEMFEYAREFGESIESGVGDVWFNTSAYFAEEEYSLTKKSNSNEFVLTKKINAETSQAEEVFNLTIFYEIPNSSSLAKVSVTIIGEPTRIGNKQFSSNGVLIAFNTEESLDLPEELPEETLDEMTIGELFATLFVEEQEFVIPSIDVDDYTLQEKTSSKITVGFEMTEEQYASLKKSFGSKYSKTENQAEFCAITLQESFLYYQKDLCVLVNASKVEDTVTFSIERWYEYQSLVIPNNVALSYSTQGGESVVERTDNTLTFTDDDQNLTKFEYDASTKLFTKFTKTEGEQEWTAIEGFYTQRLLLNEMFIDNYFEYLDVDNDLSFRWFNTNDNVVAQRTCTVYRRIMIEGVIQHQWRVLVCEGLVMKVTYNDGSGSGSKALFEILSIEEI